MTMQPGGGMLAALMGGGPLPLPKIPCAHCLVDAGIDAIERDEIPDGPGAQAELRGNAVSRAQQAVTILEGSLVCAKHAVGF